MANPKSEIRSPKSEGMDPKQEIKDPGISIDRTSMTYAVFDGFDLIKDFEPYTVEADAEAAARKWLTERTDKLPTIIYPRITKIRIHGGTVRRKGPRA